MFANKGKRRNGNGKNNCLCDFCDLRSTYPQTIQDAQFLPLINNEERLMYRLHPWQGELCRLDILQLDKYLAGAKYEANKDDSTCCSSTSDSLSLSSGSSRTTREIKDNLWSQFYQFQKTTKKCARSKCANESYSGRTSEMSSRIEGNDSFALTKEPTNDQLDFQISRIEI